MLNVGRRAVRSFGEAEAQVVGRLGGLATTFSETGN
jgi:hypothetical protein